jgi:hypothetical protein
VLFTLLVAEDVVEQYMYTIAMGIKGRKLEFSSQPRS